MRTGVPLALTIAERSEIKEVVFPSRVIRCSYFMSFFRLVFRLLLLAITASDNSIDFGGFQTRMKTLILVIDCFKKYLDWPKSDLVG